MFQASLKLYPAYQMQIMAQEIQALKSKACQNPVHINSTKTRGFQHPFTSLKVSACTQEGMLKAANEILQEKVFSNCQLTLWYKLQVSFLYIMISNCQISVSSL
jgi:hypothetical protein|uniref:Uncharacterized protein n=1 Tax=Zea mays TaxID=4577 RepID=C4J9J0_MAIZE|nr:unknown [Zea mays]